MTLASTAAAPAPDIGPSPRAMLMAGRVLSGLFTSFMAFDIGLKMLDPPIVDATMAKLGWTAGWGRPIGVLELVLVVLYLAPRRAVTGAVLITGLMGATAATHLRVGDPLASHVLFGVYLALLAWGGLWLRDARLRALFPLAR